MHSQTQEEFSLLYLAQAQDASEFPRSENLHKPRFTLSDEGSQVNDYPSSLDYRDKGYVTDVSCSCLFTLFVDRVNMCR